MQEEDADQEQLLDGPVPPVGAGHGGGLIELPLSYNLTGHTGSYMYMAPECFNVSARYFSRTAKKVAIDAELSWLTTWSPT